MLTAAKLSLREQFIGTGRGFNAIADKRGDIEEA